jgi:hypothetical protein
MVICSSLLVLAAFQVLLVLLLIAVIAHVHDCRRNELTELRRSRGSLGIAGCLCRIGGYAQRCDGVLVLERPPALSTGCHCYVLSAAPGAAGTGDCVMGTSSKTGCISASGMVRRKASNTKQKSSLSL